MRAHLNPLNKACCLGIIKIIFSPIISCLIKLVIPVLFLSLGFYISCYAQEGYHVTDEIDSLFIFDVDTSLWHIKDPQRTQNIIEKIVKDESTVENMTVLRQYSHYKSPFLSYPSIAITQFVIPEGIPDVEALLNQYDNSDLSDDKVNSKLTYQDMLSDIEVLEPMVDRKAKSIFEIFTMDNKILGRIIVEQFSFVRKNRMVMIQLHYLETGLPEGCRDSFYAAISKLR